MARMFFESSLHIWRTTLYRNTSGKELVPDGRQMNVLVGHKK